MLPERQGRRPELCTNHLPCMGPCMHFKFCSLLYHPPGLSQGAHHEAMHQSPSRGPSDSGAAGGSFGRGPGSRPGSADRASARASPARGAGGSAFAGFEAEHEGAPWRASAHLPQQEPSRHPRGAGGGTFAGFEAEHEGAPWHTSPFQ